MAYLGQASQDENKRYKGGAAGDQTGKEVYIANYYNYNWIYIEPIDTNFGNAIANAMIDACNNPNIGYDQNQRNTAYTQYKKSGSIAGISTACETDCSALVSLCVTQAGCDVLSTRSNAPTTSTLKSVLIGTGRFKQVSSPTKRGTVLLREGYHTAIWLGNSTNKSGAAVTKPTSQTTPTPTTSTGNIVFTYQVKTKEDGWLAPVNNLNDVAGVQGHSIIDIAVKVNQGSVRYRVYTTKWMSYVTGFNTKDYINGYAGDDKTPIRAVEIFFYSPTGTKCAKYRVACKGKGWYDWQLDNSKKNGMDGYAGDLRNVIDRLQLTVD